MTWVEFEENCKRLEEKYGKGHYDKAFIELLWPKVKEIPSGNFKKAVDHLIGNHFRAPGLDVIVDVAVNQIARPKFRPYKILTQEVARVSPWPVGLETLVENMKAGTLSEGDYAFRFNKVSFEEAWKLHDLYVEGKFDDPFALMIISRKSSSAAHLVIEWAKTKGKKAG
jgi:hypothetical protein